MKVNGCYNCVLCWEHSHCEAANKEISQVELGDEYFPDWCPLLKGPIMVELDKGELEEF